MSIEFEDKAIQVNPNAISERSIVCGGQQVGEAFMRRCVYDIVPREKGKWIRLRDTGKEVMLTVKKIVHEGIDGTHEVESLYSAIQKNAQYIICCFW